MVFHNGDKYEGSWALGKFDGTGDFWTYQSGRYMLTYRGQWKSGSPHGEGEQHNANGDTYQGSFLNGVRHGRGICIFATGEVYEGEWQANTRWGHGTLQTTTGTYVGQWQNDQKHGKGTWDARGFVYEGVWSHGTARCGVYRKKPGVEVGDEAPDGRQLPVLGLQNPSQVMQQAVASLLAGPTISS